MSFFVFSALMVEMSSDMIDALHVHNQARIKAVGPHRPSLIWSDSLASAAHSWAVHLANKNVLKHSSDSGQGENLFRRIGTDDTTFAMAARAWVDEMPIYQGEVIPVGDFEAYGHYTQVIWPGTREVGMASAKSKRGWTYVVARYSPPGNYVNQTAWS
ncbi:hypothetical protein EPUL_001075 [Erysiphe pulchra]|uniref:SCP domain-containing protein n=1 Tax=Erysiphe pulchra TaxID=225359 RepID=A0A2S4Q0E4_9PEZI|nr:hypothetical protein EPUL_001075 [Erysiphe pulchra]